MGLLRLLVAETPPLLSGAGLERARLDLPVLLFASLVCLLTGLAAGALPAWQAARDTPADPMREGGRSPLSLRRGVRFGLIAVEVGLSVVLLIGAGLLLRSFVRVLSQPAGIELDHRITINLALPRSRYPDPEAIRRVRRSLDERFAGIPGVVAAGANNNFPLTGSDSRRGIVIQGQENREGPTRAHTRIVTLDYFRAAGIAIASGRGFSAADAAQAPLVVVVNDTMARRYWPGQSAVGQRVQFTGEPVWREVVGVIADVRHWGLDREVNPELYMPHDQQPSASLTYVLQTSGDPLGIAAAVKAHVHAVDPDLPTGVMRTLEDVAARSVVARRWSALLLGIFAILGVVLAGAGIYGVTAHVVSMRTGEIAVRMSLGAGPASVMRSVLGEAMAQAAVGVAAGAAVAYATLRSLNALLFEITATDPLAFIGAAVTVVLAALMAGVVPAIRAMRVDPVRVLHSP
jgi:putative ABC transport system permease protein